MFIRYQEDFFARLKYKIDDFVKSGKQYFLSFRRKPESSFFKWLQMVWTPVCTGVTIFYEFIKIQYKT